VITHGDSTSRPGHATVFQVSVELVGHVTGRRVALVSASTAAALLAHATELEVQADFLAIVSGDLALSFTFPV
jgi:hypothetical protein